MRSTSAGLTFTHRAFPGNPELRDSVGVLFGGSILPFRQESSLVTSGPPARCAQCDAYWYHGCAWRISKWRCGLCGHETEGGSASAPRELAVEFLDVPPQQPQRSAARPSAEPDSGAVALIALIDLTLEAHVLDAVLRGLARSYSLLAAHPGIVFGLAVCGPDFVSVVELNAPAPACTVTIRASPAHGLLVPIQDATTNARALTGSAQSATQALGQVRSLHAPAAHVPSKQPPQQAGLLAAAVESYMHALAALAGARMFVFSSALTPPAPWAAALATCPCSAGVDLFADAACASAAPEWVSLVSHSGGHITAYTAADAHSDRLADWVCCRASQTPRGVFRGLVKLRASPELVAGPGKTPAPEPWWRVLLSALDPVVPVNLLGDGAADADTSTPTPSRWGSN
jgi:hypothetical protein